jgi:hypothetical protein
VIEQGWARLQPMGDQLTIRAETTPNPDSMKFTLNRTVTDGRPETYTSIEQAFLSPLARTLLRVPGVVGVFFLKDFVTIRRGRDADWDAIAPAVTDALRRHFDTSSD